MFWLVRVRFFCPVSASSIMKFSGLSKIRFASNCSTVSGFCICILRNFAFKSPVFGNACMRENIYITNTNFLRKTPQNAWDHICLEIWFLSKKLLLQKDWYAYLIGISKIINKLCHYGHFLLSMMNIQILHLVCKILNKVQWTVNCQIKWLKFCQYKFVVKTPNLIDTSA